MWGEHYLSEKKLNQGCSGIICLSKALLWKYQRMTIKFTKEKLSSTSYSGDWWVTEKGKKWTFSNEWERTGPFSLYYKPKVLIEKNLQCDE
jgi:hypothetical protein